MTKGKHVDDIKTAAVSKKQLIMNACEKIAAGKKLLAEGEFELDHLLKGDRPKKGSVQGVPNISEKRTHSTKREKSLFHKDTRSLEFISEQVVKYRKEHPEAKSNTIRKALNVSTRRFKRVMNKMSHKATAKAAPRPKETTLDVKRGDRIEPEVLAPEILEFLNGRAFVSKLVLESGLKVSRIPLDRALDFLTKKGEVKKVMKAHNPLHKEPKNHLRAFEYWEKA